MKSLLIVLAILPYWLADTDPYFDEYGAGWNYSDWTVAFQELLAADYETEQGALHIKKLEDRINVKFIW